MDERFVLEGIVLRGKGLGHTLGFPTANLEYDPSVLPKPGVFAGFARIGDDTAYYSCIVNCGTHPTVPEGPPTVEVHLLRYEGGPFYGRPLKVECAHYLRPETAFPDLDALKEQLALDRNLGFLWAEKNNPKLI